MSTYNNMKFMELIKKYQKTNQIKVEGNTLEILEQDKHKREHIIWNLSEYNPEMMVQLISQRGTSFTHN